MEKTYTPVELFGIECGKGWHKLIIPILKAIREYNESHPDADPINSVQIKEKYARLEIYLNYYTPELAKMIDDAGDKSEHVCEFCGSEENVGVYDNGWMTTLCYDCAKQRARERNEIASWYVGDRNGKQYLIYPDDRDDKLEKIVRYGDNHDFATIYHDDCINVMDKLISEGTKVNLTVTSPPYDNLRKYSGDVKWDFDTFKKVADRLYQLTDDGGVVVWVVGDATHKGSETCTSFKQALYFTEIGFNLHDTMIFEKANPIPQNHNRYEQCFEYMFVFSKGKPKTFNPIKVPTINAGKEMEWGNRKTVMDDNQCRRHRGSEKYVTNPTKIHKNIFTYPIGGGKTGHPAVFPLQLAVDHVWTWSTVDDTIFDPFLGSGTTLEAALKTNRKRFIGCEINGDYFEMIEQRLLKYDHIDE